MIIKRPFPPPERALGSPWRGEPAPEERGNRSDWRGRCSERLIQRQTLWLGKPLFSGTRAAVIWRREYTRSATHRTTVLELALAKTRPHQHPCPITAEVRG